MRHTLTGFEATLLACHAALYRYARSLSRDPAFGEELVQETFRRALAAKNKPSPATEEATRAWLFTILRNLWHNELRQRSRQLQFTSDPSHSEAMPGSPDALMTRSLLHSEVRDAIDNLPEAYREVVLLRDIEGFAYSEIASLINCPAGTVMSRLARARAALRQSLGTSTPQQNKVHRS